MCDLCFHCTANCSHCHCPELECCLCVMIIVCCSLDSSVCVSLNIKYRYWKFKTHRRPSIMDPFPIIYSKRLKRSLLFQFFCCYSFLRSDDQWCRELHRGPYTQGYHKYECLPMCRQVSFRQYIIDRRQ